MFTSSLKWFTGMALAAALAWSAYAGLRMFLPVLGLLIVCVVLLFAQASRASRFRTDLLHDPAVSTLVFPPESKLQHPQR